MNLGRQSYSQQGARTDRRMTKTAVFRFGKHAGHSVEEVRGDAAYCSWLREQDWFKARYPQLWCRLFAQPISYDGNVIQWASIADRFAQTAPSPTRTRRARGHVGTVTVFRTPHAPAIRNGKAHGKANRKGASEALPGASEHAQMARCTGDAQA